MPVSITLSILQLYSALQKSPGSAEARAHALMATYTRGRTPPFHLTCMAEAVALVTWSACAVCRYGRDSAAAGQGARARSRQRAEGATVGCTNGEAGIHPGASADQVKWGEVRGSSAHNTNLRLPAICRKHSCSGFGELPQPSGRGPAARRLFCWPSHPPGMGQVLDARKQREAGQPHWSLAPAGGRSTARGYLRLFL